MRTGWVVRRPDISAAPSIGWSAAHRGDPTTYRLPVGSLLDHLAGTAVVLPFLGLIASYFHGLHTRHR